MKVPVTGSRTVGPFSPGIVAQGRFVFVSGQGSVSDGEILHGTIEEETERALRNVAEVLESAGSTLANVVRCGVFLADINDFRAMNKVYENVMPKPFPARTTVGACLPENVKVEIECVALVPSEWE